MNYRKLIIITALAIAFISAKKYKTKVFTLKKFENSLSKIDSNLYASKYETTNFLYTTFLKDLKKQSKIKEFNIAQIDSVNWRSPLAYNEPYVELYHTHPAYREYPVVNISHEGAVLFCEWLTGQYNNYPKRKFNKVQFRLPTQAEWEKAAKAGRTGVIYPWAGCSLHNYKGCAMSNYSCPGGESIHYDKEQKKLVVITDGSAGGGMSKFSDNSDITAPVNTHNQNDFNMYSISGNVKEMVQEKGITRGGGWRSPGYDVRIASADTYTKSGDDIGFRYFMEIIEL